MDIVATSGGFLIDYRRRLYRVGPMLDYALALTKKKNPKVCFLETASGDDPGAYLRAYAAITAERPEVRPNHLQLFTMPNVDNVRDHLLSQDLIWVGGGSVANLLSVWRTHGVDQVMREAWEAGVVLGGVSAGSICWHVGGTTDSFGPQLEAVTAGLGLLPFSNSPHFSSEANRKELHEKLVTDGILPDGYATDDGVGLHFRGTELHKVISDRPDAAAYQIAKGPDGRAHSVTMEPQLLTPFSPSDMGLD